MNSEAGCLTDAACPGFRPLYGNIECCPACGLGHTVGFTEPVDAQNYLDPTAVGGALRPAYFAELYAAHVAGSARGRALDVGCGQGEWVRLLQSRGWVAHGIDAYAGFQPDGVSYFRSSLKAFEPRAPYDLITLVHCFEHVAEPKAALHKIASMLNPGGRLLIVVPNFGGAWSQLLRERWHMLKTEHHVFHYTPHSLAQIVRGRGYDLENIATYSGYAPSSWQLRLSEAQFYERGIGSMQPLRSAVFRANRLLRPLVNRLTDRALMGAEIQLLARRPAAN